jgi:polysaccharide pyruvyl transferase WcaK-like protein
MAYKSYQQLMKYILENTDATIALIPHVVWDSNDDRKVLKQLYEDFEQDERIVLVEDHTAPQLKYIISLCDFFVGARTHATIAAYSSCVPTLVVGYSVKARGIAKDLFGSDNGYVLPVQLLKSSDDLVSAFRRLYEKRETIAEGLKRDIPEYKNSAIKAKQAVEDLIKA